jgi:phosphoserine aminotransferase
MFHQSKVHNFNAGPSTLPREVRRNIVEAIESLNGGPGILELSHRSSTFFEIVEQAKAEISLLYQLPDTHDVLFLQGGASLQFAMIPYNLGTRGGFITTGEWSKRAFAEAKRLVSKSDEQPIELHSEASRGFRTIPQRVSLLTSGQPLQYIHLTSNNTIFGTQYLTLPEFEHTPKIRPPLVVDASSDLFSRAVDWSRVDLLYGGAQKNAGPAGVTVVIGRKNLLRRPAVQALCPKILEYRTHAEKNSLYHTPNTLGIFGVGEVAKWVNQRGGVSAMNERAMTRAAQLYQIIDESKAYIGHADTCARSQMNITFRGRSPDIEARLLAKATQLNMFGLKGHRNVGGLRASLYNAIPEESVLHLYSLLKEIDQEF